MDIGPWEGLEKNSHGARRSQSEKGKGNFAQTTGAHKLGRLHSHL